MYSIDSAKAMDDLLEISGEIIDSKLQKKDNKKNIEVIKIELENGDRILIGKNNKQNDYIISKLADEDDLWFHVHNNAGSHVLLKSKNVTDELILRCAKFAKEYSTTVDAIIYANPNIDADNLSIGEEIIIPFGNVVQTNISYTSQILNLNINALKAIYPFLEVSSIGTSVLGRPLRAIRFGSGQKEVLYCAATHANEWITSPLLMKFLESISKSYVNNLNIFGVNARELFNNVSLYFLSCYQVKKKKQLRARDKLVEDM